MGTAVEYRQVEKKTRAWKNIAMGGASLLQRLFHFYLFVSFSFTSHTCVLTTVLFFLLLSKPKEAIILLDRIVLVLWWLVGKIRGLQTLCRIKMDFVAQCAIVRRCEEGLEKVGHAC